VVAALLACRCWIRFGGWLAADGDLRALICRTLAE
jgi:hypothetical protein